MFSARARLFKFLAKVRGSDIGELVVWKATLRVAMRRQSVFREECLTMGKWLAMDASATAA